MLSLPQLRGLGVTRAETRHHLSMERWRQRTSNVVSTTTGPLSREQQMWMAVLHGGPTALLGGLSAAEAHGMKNWHRDDITVIVDDDLSFEPLPGVIFFRSRRPNRLLRSRDELPTCQIEPAVLLFAAYEPNHRTAHGCLAAAVQQRLTTPAKLALWIETLRPLRRAREFRRLISDLEGGAHSLAEVDVRKACRQFGISCRSVSAAAGTDRAATATPTASGGSRTAGHLCSKSMAPSTTTYSRQWTTGRATASSPIVTPSSFTAAPMRSAITRSR